MNRAEFMERLQELLEDIPQAEREDALQYYNDYLDDAGTENENAALAALGSPERIADSIRVGLQDGEDFGEFTEEGFRMDEGEKREPVPVSGWTEKTEADKNGAESDEKNGFGNWACSGTQENGTAGPGMGRHGGPGPGTNGYGGPGPGMSGCGAYGPGPSGFGPGNSGGFGSQGPGSQGPGSQGRWNGPDMSAAGPQRPQKRSAGEIILLILSCLFLVPVLVPLGLGAVIIAFVFLVCVLVFFACIVITGIVVLVVGGALVVFAIANLAAFPTSAVCILGGGMVCVGIGLLLTLLMCWLAVNTVPALCRGFVRLCSLPFHRKR